MGETFSRYRWVIVAMTSLTNLLDISFIGASVTSLLLYTIKTDLNLTGIQISLLASAGSFTAWLALFAGILADRYGVRRICGIGIMITSISALCKGFSTNFWTFFLASELFGIGNILFIPNPPKLLRVWFPSKELGLANGINMAGVGAGSALAVALVTITLAFVGSWRYIFIVYAIPAFVGVILWWLFVQDKPFKKGTVVSKTRTSPFKGLRQVVKVRNVQIQIIEKIFSGPATVAFATFFPYLLQMRGYSLQEAGVMTTIKMWCGTLGNFIIPVITDRVKKRKPLYIISAIIITSCSFLMLLDLPLILWIIPVLYGFFSSGRNTLSLIVTTESVGPKYGGTATGFLMTFSSFMSLGSSLIIGYLIDVYGSFIAPFLFAAVMELGLAIASLSIKEAYATTKNEE